MYYRFIHTIFFNSNSKSLLTHSISLTQVTILFRKSLFYVVIAQISTQLFKEKKNSNKIQQTHYVVSACFLYITILLTPSSIVEHRKQYKLSYICEQVDVSRYDQSILLQQLCGKSASLNLLSVDTYARCTHTHTKLTIV